MKWKTYDSQSEVMKIHRIMSEIFISFCKFGAKDLDIKYKEECDRYIIEVISDYTENKDYIEGVFSKYLCIARQEEMENYYWELAGHYTDDNVLTLVGMMTDDVQIQEIEDKLKIVLVRKKAHTMVSC